MPPLPALAPLLAARQRCSAQLCLLPPQSQLLTWVCSGSQPRQPWEGRAKGQGPADGGSLHLRSTFLKRYPPLILGCRQTGSDCIHHRATKGTEK